MSSSHSYEKAGDYEIAMTLTDDDGASDSALMSVVVKSSTISTDALRGIIVGLNIPRGLKNHLLSILENIPRFLKHHQIHAAVHQLKAFIHFVEAQHGKNSPEKKRKN